MDVTWYPAVPVVAWPALERGAALAALNGTSAKRAVPKKGRVRAALTVPGRALLALAALGGTSLACDGGVAGGGALVDADPTCALTVPPAALLLLLRRLPRGSWDVTEPRLSTLAVTFVVVVMRACTLAMAAWTWLTALLPLRAVRACLARGSDATPTSTVWATNVNDDDDDRALPARRVGTALGGTAATRTRKRESVSWGGAHQSSGLRRDHPNGTPLGR